MNVSQNGGHDISDNPETPHKSMTNSTSTTRIQFADVDWPFQTILFVDNESEDDAVVPDYPLGGASDETVSRLPDAYGDIPTVLLSSGHAIPQSLMKMVDTSVDKFAGPLALLLALEELLQGSE
jgi:hypothetical protein